MHRLAFALLLLAAGNLSAQTISADTIRRVQIKKYPDHWFIWPVVKQRSASFEIRKRNSREDLLNYKPNSTISMGVGLYVFEVGVELAVAVPLNEKSRSRYGVSDVRDWNGQVVGKGWGLDFFSQKYSSFYLSNPSPRIKSPAPYPIRADLQLRNFGMNGLYVFDRKRFSLRSAYNFAERQLQSGGSLILAGTFSSVQLESDSVIVSSQLQSRLKLDDTFSYLRYTTLSAAPGYSYNVIYNNWFVNLTLSIGPAHHWVYFEDREGQPSYDIAINTFVDGRLAMGYNSDRWFGGIGFINQSRDVRFDGFQFTTNNSSFRMLIGYRIVEKGILKKRALDFLPRLNGL